MPDITETIVFHKSIANSDTGTLEYPIPYDCHVVRIQYFFARNQQNLLQVDVKVAGQSVQKYEKNSNAYMVGDGYEIDVRCYTEGKAEQKLQCWYNNADADDPKTLFVVVHILRKLTPEEADKIAPFKWWM
ncbi:MAG: hypothetical protein HWN68_15235 [Desulfobacterales bacterium]|nr:hypothetical protein [Desulfobacterales bacterium]